MPVELLSPTLSPDIDALQRTVAIVRAELDHLEERRRRDALRLSASWQGGHRERFELERDDIERRTRAVVDSLAQFVRLQRRALDEAVR